MSRYSRVLKVVVDAPPDPHDRALAFWRRLQEVESWRAMRDPAGLLFCVLPVSPGSLNDENAQRWE